MEQSRTAHIERNTKETQIDLTLNIDGKAEYENTALHKATRRLNVEAASLLLEHEANPKLFKFVHKTPLHIAAVGGHVEMVNLYLEIPNIAGLVGDDNLTALEHALQVRQYDTAELLIEKGANINRIQPRGDTMLHGTITGLDYRTARFLIRAGADVNIPNSEGVTTYDLLRRKQLTGLIDLIEIRDNPDAVTNSVESASNAGSQ